MIDAPVITYRSGYKYQLTETWSVQTPITGCPAKIEGYIELDACGLLTIRASYAWDGPSGPTIDTRSFMRGSLLHDALYQLMREGGLDQRWRERADRLLADLCREDGMSPISVALVYAALREFAGPAARGETRPLRRAP